VSGRTRISLTRIDAAIHVIESVTLPPRTPTTIEDNPNWRRHKGACVNYRERWSSGDEVDDDGCRLLYQIVCLMGTPPETTQEQTRCMGATRGCWRLTRSKAAAVSDSEEADGASPRTASTKRNRYASSLP
jgi:hypothetical protein